MGRLEYNCKQELGLTKQSTSTSTDSADTGTEGIDTEDGNTCIGSHNIGTGSDVLAIVLLV